MDIYYVAPAGRPVGPAGALPPGAPPVPAVPSGSHGNYLLDHASAVVDIDGESTNGGHVVDLPADGGAHVHLDLDNASAQEPALETFGTESDDDGMQAEHDADEAGGHPFDAPPSARELAQLAGEMLDESAMNYEHASMESNTRQDLSVNGTAAATNAETDEDQLAKRVRRRLNTKTSPAATAYASSGGDTGVVEGLLTRREFRAEGVRHAARRRRIAAEQNLVVREACRHIERHVGLLASAGAPSGQASTDDWTMSGVAFHESHVIVYAGRSGIAYCRVCAAWTSGARAKNLKRACAGFCVQRGLLRRLSLGLAPLGVRIPAEWKRPGARGTRGGV